MKPKPTLPALLQSLAKQGCRPALVWIGNTWRAQVNVGEQPSADASTPYAAMQEAQSMWQATRNAK